jgi:cell filamentation protein
MSDPYVYPETGVLRNKLGLGDAKKLDYHEREIVTMRARQGIPTGEFDLRHLRTIHRHLFQDIYEWAGEIRTVEISKGESQFQFRQYIETGMADVHRRIVKATFLRGLQQPAFATEAARIIGDVNYVHPFREGNGRSQLYYLQQLSEQAGHPLDLTRIDAAGWLEASKEAHRGRYDRMGQVIADALRLG